MNKKKKKKPVALFPFTLLPDSGIEKEKGSPTDVSAIEYTGSAGLRSFFARLLDIYRLFTQLSIQCEL